MELPRIIGIAGTNGSGKDTFGTLVAEKKKYAFVSLSDILRNELTEKGIPHDRVNMRAQGALWQQVHGPGYLSRRAIEMYNDNQKVQGYNGLAIGSVRRTSEAKVIQDSGGAIVWIDAERGLRYQWIKAAKRGRHEDAIDYEEWVRDEDIESTPQVNDDESLVNLDKVKDIADIRIINNFSSSKDFKNYIITSFNL